MRTRFFRLWIVAFALAAVLPAQDVTGSVQGQIADATGAPLPDARVELINEDL